jgi:hypothetical protein
MANFFFHQATKLFQVQSAGASVFQVQELGLFHQLPDVLHESRAIMQFHSARQCW